MKWCCEELKNYLKEIEKYTFKIGEGEIIRYISMDNDFIPFLPFRYCPFCGKHLKKDIKPKFIERGRKGCPGCGYTFKKYQCPRCGGE